MNEFGLKSPDASVADLGLKNVSAAYWNLTPAELIEETIIRGEGEITDTGALAVDTGEFTGRSPKDKFIVRDQLTESSIDWNKINQPLEPSKFESLLQKMQEYLKGKELWVRDVYACADPKYRTNVRVITETPWANLFADNMFLRPSDEEKLSLIPDWHV